VFILKLFNFILFLCLSYLMIELPTIIYPKFYSFLLSQHNWKWIVLITYFIVICYFYVWYLNKRDIGFWNKVLYIPFLNSFFSAIVSLTIGTFHPSNIPNPNIGIGEELISLIYFFIHGIIFSLVPYFLFIQKKFTKNKRSEC